MENNRRNGDKDKRDQDIVFSKTIKAGKRIYYIDVKKNRKEDYFLAITESKRIQRDESDRFAYEFEKHKIFLYKEDFEKFTLGLDEALAYIKEHVTHEEQSDWTENQDAEEGFVLEDEISFNVEGFE